MEDEKIVIHKKSISKYLKPVAKNYIIGPHDHLVIDKEGNLYELGLNIVRKLNGSSWQYPDERETYGEAISYWVDYIDISFGGSNMFYVNISNAVRPTEAQIQALLDYIDMIYKAYKVFFWAVDWRWSTGGGNSTGICYKQPTSFKKKLAEVISKEQYRGIRHSYYEVEDEG